MLPVFLLFIGHALAGQTYQDYIIESLSLLKDGLKTYPDVHLHLGLASHPDLARLEAWFGQTVSQHVETFLKDLVDRGQRIQDSKENTITKLSSMINKTDFQSETSLQELKTNLVNSMADMIQDMHTGEGSLDFELDDLARTGLGDMYLFLKSKISSAVRGQLERCASQCGLDHPLLVSALALLQRSKPETVADVLIIALGLPGLDTRYIRPQLVKARSSLGQTKDQDFAFLVSVGEWLNDVLNAGLVVLQRPFGEIRGKLTELLGSTKDQTVPKLKEILDTLKQAKIGFLSDELNLIVRKYFGQF